MRLAQRTYTNILQNLGWAFGYNAAAIPLAAVGLLNPGHGRRSHGHVQRLRRRQQPAPVPIRPGEKGRSRAPARAGRRRASLVAAWVAPVLLLATTVGTVRWIQAPGPVINRTVYLDMGGASYVPDQVAVGRGERVRLVFHNDSRVTDTAVIGGTRHVTVPTGGTGAAVVRFARPGQVPVGCWQAGHLVTGMQATIVVT